MQSIPEYIINIKAYRCEYEYSQNGDFKRRKFYHVSRYKMLNLAVMQPCERITVFLKK